MTPVSVRTIRTTWSRGAATLHTLHFRRSKYGARVQVWLWADGGREVEAVSGDGRTHSFKRFERRELPTTTTEAEMFAVARAMADQYFA